MAATDPVGMVAGMAVVHAVAVAKALVSKATAVGVGEARDCGSVLLAAAARVGRAAALAEVRTVVGARAPESLETVVAVEMARGSEEVGAEVAGVGARTMHTGSWRS